VFILPKVHSWPKQGVLNGRIPVSFAITPRIRRTPPQAALKTPGFASAMLKPSNVLIDQSDQPRIMDFGLAKRLTGESDLTVSGQIMGSPNFMAPEQAQGRHGEVGPPSDVYSIGTLLYHLLTGRPPFQAATLTEVLRQVASIAPAAPRLLNPTELTGIASATSV
jgi:serine/threonine protein kinase